MPEFVNPKHAAEIILRLRRRQEFSHQPVAGGELSPQLAMLRAWQSQRLANTYADLLASERFAPACRFFLSDVYAPRDFSQRNTDMQRMYDFLNRFLPAGVLQTLSQTIALHELTELLDAELLDVLVQQLGISHHITPQHYAEAYRICDNYQARKLQIDMIVDIGRGIDRLVHLPFVGWTLRRARGPALRAGWHELQSFLERGYAAFKHMGRADEFLHTIQRREMQILDQIFAGAADPFQVD